jgi:hypothetical protein
MDYPVYINSLFPILDIQVNICVLMENIKMVYEEFMAFTELWAKDKFVVELRAMSKLVVAYIAMDMRVVE